MKTRLIAAAAILLVLCAGVFAHRLDEYLQATILSVGKDRVQASMRLVPGVAGSSVGLASIDTGGGGGFFGTGAAELCGAGAGGLVCNGRWKECAAGAGFLSVSCGRGD